MSFPSGAAARIAPPRIGTAAPAVYLQKIPWSGDDVRIVIGTADIRSGADWTITGTEDVLIVHLGGRIAELETQLERHGGSSGPPVPGEVWTVPAGRRYQSFARGETIHYAAFYFGHSDAAPRSGELSSASGHFDGELHGHARRLAELLQRQRDTDLMNVPELAEQVRRRTSSTLARGRAVEREKVPALAPAECRRAREYILESLSGPIRLEDLSRLLGVSVHHLLPAFRQAFGTTPAKYVLRQRIRAAQRLLLGSTLDITAIALRTGFSSHSHLTEVFRRHIGFPPSAFREGARCSPPSATSDSP